MSNLPQRETGKKISVFCNILPSHASYIIEGQFKSVCVEKKEEKVDIV